MAAATESRMTPRAEAVLAALTPGGTPPWELGKKKKWLELERRLEASGIEDLWVTDESAEGCIDVVRATFDVTEDGLCLLHQFAGASDDGGLFCRLLALGLHPDLRDNWQCSPSHMCSYVGGLRRAEALVSCRPDLTAQDSTTGRRTPVEAVECMLKVWTNRGLSDDVPHFGQIRDTFKNHLESGFPSLAQLAYEKKWFAVKNLCRRRAVDFEEISERHEGKDVMQWAEVHGQPKLAEEIRYLFNLSKSEDEEAEEPFETANSRKLEEVVALTASRVTGLEVMVDKLTSFKTHIGSVEFSVKNELEEIHAKIRKIDSRDVSAMRRASVAIEETKTVTQGGPIVAAIGNVYNAILENAVKSGIEVDLLKELTGVMGRQLPKSRLAGPPT